MPKREWRTKRATADPDVIAAFDAPLSHQAIADVLGVSSKLIQQLVVDGRVNVPPGGSLTARIAVQGYIAYLQAAKKENTITAAKTRKGDLQADLLEIKIAKETRDLQEACIADALAAVDEILGGMRAGLIAVPARVTSDLEVRRKMEIAINDVLRSTVERIERSRQGEEEGEGDPDASEPVQPGRVVATQSHVPA